VLSEGFIDSRDSRRFALEDVDDVVPKVPPPELAPRLKTVELSSVVLSGVVSFDDDFDADADAEEEDDDDEAEAEGDVDAYKEAVRASLSGGEFGLGVVDCTAVLERCRRRRRRRYNDTNMFTAVVLSSLRRCSSSWPPSPSASALVPRPAWSPTSSSAIAQ